MTPEQEAWIENKYGVKIGSRVIWKPSAIKKESYPAIRRKMSRDGIGVVVNLGWFDNATPTATVDFANRKRMERGRDWSLVVANVDDFFLVPRFMINLPAPS